MALSRVKRELLRMKFGGKCAYCGADLTDGWHADHVKAVVRKYRYISGKYVDSKYIPSHLEAIGEVYKPENDNEDNLFPSCRACNIHKSSSDLEGWRKELERLTGVLWRNYPTYRHALRFSQVVAQPGPVIFWYEKYGAVI